ncbi:hypothetical protein LCGC14_1111200 [marine sediment metagenome]|uniref:Uncharacterized protein n=1 Tax=marine sediment metagenome TaxID=412755 RepID=A0A0F9QCS8_9ZZZZ
MEQSEVRAWLQDNATMQPNIELAPAELDHIAMCMHHIWQWYFEGRPLGDFLTAVVQDKFAEACVRADDVNRKAFYLYALFLANKIGFNYRDKALGKKKEGD